MSKSVLAPYRVIGESAAADYGFTQSAIRCYAGSRGLTTKVDGDVLIPKDLNHAEDPFGVEVDVSLRSLRNLFHPHPNAVALPGAALGIALFWESRESGQRGAGIPVHFGENDEVGSRTLSLRFPKGMLRNEVIVIPKLFLHTPAPATLPGFCSQQGGVLGALDAKHTIIIDGDGSRFPITEVPETDPSAPLWRVEMDWSDPTEDSFIENFKIVLNSNHRDFDSLRRIENPQEGQDVVPVALKEVLTSCLFGFMVKLQGSVEWNDILEGKSAPLSVGRLGWSFINHKSWSLLSPPELLRDIHQTIQGESS